MSQLSGVKVSNGKGRRRWCDRKRSGGQGTLLPSSCWFHTSIAYCVECTCFSSLSAPRNAVDVNGIRMLESEESRDPSHSNISFTCVSRSTRACFRPCRQISPVRRSPPPRRS